jgi:uncharacterized UPF0160 family protein
MTDIKDTALTHGGKFHADDVFAAALLKIRKPDIKIIRSFEIPEGFDGIVFDIGFGKFDHHQKDAEVRESGAPYAAFGLLWREFGKETLLNAGCPEDDAAEEAAHFDERFISYLDEDDNLGTGSELAGIIETFNPGWDSESPTDEAFEEAVGFAGTVLRKKIESVLGVNRAKGFVREALERAKDYIVILPKFAPWRSVLTQSGAEFVIYPSQRGGYSAQAVPSETNDLKSSFPKEWAGRTEDELKKISGIPTLTFCHRGRFLISADTLEDTIKACRAAHEKVFAGNGFYKANIFENRKIY